MWQTLFWPPFWNGITFFKFYFSNVNLFMFSYFEPNFIEKSFWESGFSNFGHMTVFAKWKLVFWPPFWNGKCFSNVPYKRLFSLIFHFLSPNTQLHFMELIYSQYLYHHSDNFTDFINSAMTVLIPCTTDDTEVTYQLPVNFPSYRATLIFIFCDSTTILLFWASLNGGNQRRLSRRHHNASLQCKSPSNSSPVFSSSHWTCV